MNSILTVTVNPAVDLTVAVDCVVPTHKLRCKSPVRDPGGGGVNVARVVHRLGGSVAAACTAGGGTGMLLRKLIGDEQLQCRVLDIDNETRENMTVLEESSGKQYRFVLPGPRLVEREWQAFLDLVRRAGTGAAFLVVSGSLAPGIPDDFYARCAKVAKQIGTRFILDCAGPPLAAAIDEHVHMVKPSLREFEELVGRKFADERACADAAHELVSTGKVNIIVLSLGERGALLVTRERTMRASALPVVPLSTVGAGDSLLGGFVWQLAAGCPIEDALRYGMAAGAATLLQPGTRLCSPTDVHRLVGDVVIARLEERIEAAKSAIGQGH